jgi:spore germination protein YaaH
MNIILQAGDVNNSPELFQQATHSGILTDVANHTPRIDKIIQLMHNWGYKGVNYDFINNAINELNN